MTETHVPDLDDRTTIASLEPGTRATVKGWVDAVRDLGSIVFLTVRDRTGEVQVCLREGDLPDRTFETARDLAPESAVAVSGTVESDDRAPGGIELSPDELDVLARAKRPLPFDRSGTADTARARRLDYRTLDLRRDRVATIFRARDAALAGIRDALRGFDAVEITAPKLIDEETESNDEQLAVSYFGREAYLNQSPLQYKQRAASTDLERVFEVAKMHTGEKHDHPRLLNEATVVSFEAAFVDLPELRKIAETTLDAAYARVRETCGDRLDPFDAAVSTPEPPYRTLTYRECLEIANEVGDQSEELTWGDNPWLATGRSLGGHLDGPYVVTDWPTSFRPDYVRHHGEDPPVAEAFTILSPRAVQIEGSIREHRHDRRADALAGHGDDAYLDAFAYGLAPHGGWSLGVERVLLGMLGLGDIREAVLFPRDFRRIEP